MENLIFQLTRPAIQENRINEKIHDGRLSQRIRDESEAYCLQPERVSHRSPEQTSIQDCFLAL